VKFPTWQFREFCSELVVDTKEHGRIKLSKLLGTQNEALKQIVSGLEDDKHFFVILKARQLGVTTIVLALDLFWHWRYPGMQGTLAADSDRNVAGFRTTLNMFYSGLPKKYRIEAVENNRMQMAFKNRSRLMFQVGGGSRRKGQGGRGMAITYLHGTECSSWSDEESLASILASLAETNPQRLHIFESTARGFNLYHDMWETAKDSVTQKAIFIGWWHNELYSVPNMSKVFQTYWGVNGKMTAEERELCRTVQLKYGKTIDMHQIAWHRWKLEEVIKDERLMAQEYPWHDDMAFVTSGSQFFSASRLQEIDQAIRLIDVPKYYRFGFGTAFEHTQVEECNVKQALLTVWEQPEKRGIYAIGADPAYGSSDWADRFAIEVFRCYADRVVQVAEFATPNLNTYQFAWVLCYIAGFYGNSMVNLEVNGPGMAVLAEMDHLKRHASTLPGGQMSHFLNSARAYLYKRLDAMGGGFVKHWKTTRDTKERMLNIFKDHVERGEAVLASHDLVDECRGIERDDGFLGAPDRKKDDRVIASGLAVEAWFTHMRLNLLISGETYEAATKRHVQEEETGELIASPLQGTVQNFLKERGIKTGSMKR